MNPVGLHLGPRNPVWVVPLALPLAIFASGELNRALLFVWLLPAAVVLAHAIAAVVEPWVPRRLRIAVMAIVAAAVVTVAEVILRRTQIGSTSETLLMVRLIAVSGAMVWPALAAHSDEGWRVRFLRAVGVAVGFAVGLTILTAARLSLAAIGLQPGDSVAVGFLVLAAGRIVVFMIRDRRRRSAS